MVAKGTYSIFIDGQFICKSNNIITSQGKNSILRFMAGVSNSFAGAIGAGISDTTPGVDDTELGYEILREPISIRSVDYTSNDILFKAEFPTGTRMVIYEIGLYPDSDGARSRILFHFDDSEDWSNVTDRNLSDIRIGSSGISANALSGGSQTYTLANSALDFVDMLPPDLFSLAIVSPDNNCESITVTFTDYTGNTTDGVFTPIADTAYQIIEVQKQNFSVQTVSWERITQIDIVVQAVGGEDTLIVLDGLRTVDSSVMSGSEIVSKTTLGDPVVKEAEQTLDIQYSLGIPL